MGELAISCRGLRKSYRGLRGGRRVAVDGLDLEVPRGGVHGFLGPNGSGKTTTIKMLLGLVRPDAGSITLLGAEVPGALPSVIGRVGAVVERPRFFPHFSGRLNLELAADAVGAPRKRVDRVLEQVGLQDRAKDSYRGYSLGMQQRLAVASTLLKDPEVLIFDEPTNGLDPSGIHEVRETIRNLGREGRTVLVSSHILSEVEQMADTVSIIGKGRLITSGSVVELLGARASRMRIRVDDPTRAAQLLVQKGFSVVPEGTALLVEADGDPARITRLLADDGLYLRELVSVRRDLEAVYLELTHGQGPAPTHGPGIALPPLPTHPTPPDMTRLVLAELRRLAHRRLTLVTLLALLAGMGLLGFAAWEGTRPPTAAQVAESRVAWEQSVADWEKNKQTYIAQCEDSNAMARKYGGSETPCTRDYLGPSEVPYGSEPQPVSQMVSGLEYLAAFGLSAASILIGASFVAAEFTTGNMAGWLVHEPRRSRVFWSKLLALAAGLMALCVVACCLALAGVWVIAALNGLAHDLTGPQQATLLLRLCAAILLAVAAGLTAAGLAFLTRHTAAVLGIAGLEVVVSFFLTSSEGRLQRYGLATTLEAWLTGRAEYIVAICDPGRVNCMYPTRVLERPEAAAFLFGGAMLLVLLGWWAFRHRDVA